ncbi:MAG: hypothetical protein ACLGG7_10745 [Bacteriovoracia bacterium]
MKKFVFAVVFALMATSAFAVDLKTMSFEGSSSCLVYHTSATQDNFAIVCDGNVVWLTNAPSRVVLGKDGFKTFTKAYKSIMKEKCDEAGLLTYKTIDDGNFWGFFCHR